MKKMRKCTGCNAYSLKECHCNLLTASAHPPPFNPNEKYAGARRKAKGMV